MEFFIPVFLSILSVIIFALLIELIIMHYKKIGNWIETKNSIKNDIKTIFRKGATWDDIPDSMFSFLNEMSKRELCFMRKTILSQIAEKPLN